MTHATIATHLWLQEGAEEAAQFYTALFEGARITDTLRWREGWDTPDDEAVPGAVLTVTVELAGQRIVLMNGGPAVRLNEGASIMVVVDDQAEVNRLWAALTADGGREGPCGWCADRWGVSWQIVPAALDRALADSDSAAAAQAFQAMIGMGRLDGKAIEAAARGDASTQAEAA